jgi:hypothetical protein
MPCITHLQGGFCLPPDLNSARLSSTEHRFSVDLTQSASSNLNSVPSCDRDRVERLSFQEMEKCDPLARTQRSMIVLESKFHLPFRTNHLPASDGVSFRWRPHHVAKFYDQRVWSDFHPVCSDPFGNDRTIVGFIAIHRLNSLAKLLAVLSPDEQMQMPAHCCAVRESSARGNVGVVCEIQHPEIGRAPQTGPKVICYRPKIHMRRIGRHEASEIHQGNPKQ